MKKHLIQYSKWVMLICFLLSGCDNSPKQPKPPEVKLNKITLHATPITTNGSSFISLALGNNQPIKATGFYTNNTSKDITNSVSWHTTTAELCSVDKNIGVKGLKKGKCTIHASYQNIKSASLNITITDAVLKIIQVEPALINVIEQTQTQLSITGNYSDGTTAPVTSNLALENGTNEFLTLSETGILKALKEGSTTIKIKKDNLISNEIKVNIIKAKITSISVTPESLILPTGTTQSISAIATYENGMSNPITGAEIWQSNPVGVVNISSSGEISSNAKPNTQTTIFALKDGVQSNEVNVLISDAIISQITIPMENFTIPVGATKELKAMALYSDGSSSDVSSTVTWTPSNEKISIDQTTDLLLAIETGETSFSANQNDVVSENNPTITIIPNDITDLAVSAERLILYPTAQEQITAVATYLNGNTLDISGDVAWTIVPNNIATISAEGLLSAVSAGNAEVIATIKTSTEASVTGRINIEVTNKIPVCGNVSGQPIDTSAQGGINNKDQNNANGLCLKIMQHGFDVVKWYTSPPSVNLVLAADFEWDNTGVKDGKTYAGYTSENGSHGPDNGSFVTFRQDGPNGGQYQRWCQYLSSINFANRSNWRRAIGDEMKNIHGSVKYDGMYQVYGWPTTNYYTSSTIVNNQFDTRNLYTGMPQFSASTEAKYGSCVSIK